MGVVLQFHQLLLARLLVLHCMDRRSGNSWWHALHMTLGMFIWDVPTRPTVLVFLDFLVLCVRMSISRAALLTFVALCSGA
jgi:hypothetical protein